MRLNYSSLSFLLEDSTASNCILEISTLSFARGNRALKVYAPSNKMATSTAEYLWVYPLPSIHSNFNIIDDFSGYDDGTVSPEVGGWNSVESSSDFAKIIPESIDMSDRTGISMWGKSEYSVCLYVAFEDSTGNRTSYQKFGYLPKRWKRMESSMSDLTTIDDNNIKKILFKFDSDANATFLIDEIITFGTNDGNRNKEWIPLYITKAGMNKDSRTNVGEIVGGYGDIIHQDRAYSARGNMTFKTSHTEMDNDVRFIDIARRMQTKLFLRMGGEGWPIYLSDYTQIPEETLYGVRSEVQIKFIEAE